MAHPTGSDQLAFPVELSTDTVLFAIHVVRNPTHDTVGPVRDEDAVLFVIAYGVLLRQMPFVVPASVADQLAVYVVQRNLFESFLVSLNDLFSRISGNDSWGVLHAALAIGSGVMTAWRTRCVGFPAGLPVSAGVPNDHRTN